MNETIEKYDKTELRVFASDVARLGAHIAERVEEKRKPTNVWNSPFSPQGSISGGKIR
jgi:hypothetical protein